MKKLFLFVFAALAFAACEQAPIEEQSAVLQDATKSITVSFEGDNDTRIQLNEAQKTVWTEGDHVSVFYRSSVNEEWQFMGKTGDRTGQIVPVDNSVNPPATHNRVVVIYPYNNEYYLNTETYSIEASLPAVQNYLRDSYGTNGNIMVSSSDYKQVSLKSVYGWLKLQLTGDGEVVKSITLRGNNGEQVAGELHINTSDATCVLASASGDAGDGEVGGTLVRPGTILTEVTLDCGEGVALGKNATAFYIALPPQTFEKGFTVEIEDTEGYIMEQSTDKALLIERNTIKPMAALEFINPTTPSAPTPASNEIWYTSSDGNIVEPYNTDVFGANITSNTYTDGKGIITFDGNVTTIGDSAFFDRNRLTSMNIPNSVTTIGDMTFYSCNGLTNVNIPDIVTTIGNMAFYGCDRLTSVNIPDNTTTIESWAFFHCSSLTSVNIPDSVTSIGNEAFCDCFKLTSVNIPDSVTTIGEWAFDSCESMTSVNIPNSVTTIEEGAFSSCASLTCVNIPDSITSIGELAFSSCYSLTSVTIGDSVTTIGKAAFAYCDSLTEFSGKFVSEDGRCLIIDGTLNSFAPYGLTEYTIPDSVTTIGVAAFQYCESLTSVTIGDSVTTIGNCAFYNCYSLKSVYCKATTPPALGSYFFGDNGSGRKIYVPAESVDAYKSAGYWSWCAADVIVGYDFKNGAVIE